MPAIPKGEPSRIAIANGCLAFSPLIAFHSKKPSTGRIQRRRVSIAEHRQPRDSLRFRVYGFASAFGGRGPTRDQSPAQRVERHLPRIVVAPDDQEFLARCAVVTSRIIVELIVLNVQPANDRQLKRQAALDHSSPHITYIFRIRLPVEGLAVGVILQNNSLSSGQACKRLGACSCKRNLLQALVLPFSARTANSIPLMEFEPTTVAASSFKQACALDRDLMKSLRVSFR
jgi:hypothetical protein